ncbi:uncharacterized protein YcfL [Methanomicrobium sp. W14]|uniref:hypothetical protein n=1 Tax=Methanomicrobium sp. W14 TaxID=2817839 RepID=UPI001AE7C1DC|nr:hypothetical protein [Methanomicrobium sp. W14]MBP2132948.1 uncharacterized protein YcfL [Methanomicrobium sp. W14]
MHKKIVLLIAAAIVACVFISGCSSTDSILNKPENTTVTQVTPTASVLVHDEPFVVRGDGIPDDIMVNISAVPATEDSAVLVYYVLNSSETGVYSNSNSSGWNIVVTAFAYNPYSAPENFDPKNVHDIIDSGVPYKSRNIRLFPDNVYNDRIEVSKSPDGNSINPDEPYNYGIILTLQ